MILFALLFGCSGTQQSSDEVVKPPLPDPVDMTLIYNSLMYGEIEPCG